MPTQPVVGQTYDAKGLRGLGYKMPGVTQTEYGLPKGWRVRPGATDPNDIEQDPTGGGGGLTPSPPPAPGGSGGGDMGSRADMPGGAGDASGPTSAALGSGSGGGGPAGNFKFGGLSALNPRLGTNPMRNSMNALATMGRIY